MRDIEEVLTRAAVYIGDAPREVWTTDQALVRDLAAALRGVIEERDQLRAEKAEITLSLSTLEENYREVQEENAQLKATVEKIKALSDLKGVEAWRRCYVKLQARAEEAETLLEECEQYLTFNNDGNMWPLLAKLRARKEGT